MKQQVDGFASSTGLAIAVPSPAEEKEFDASSFPWARLWVHIVQKGWQVGSVVGTSVVLPVMLYRTGISPPKYELLGRALTASGVAGVGLASSLGTYLSVTKIDREGVEERAYKLHYNEAQNHTDHWARIGALGGASVGAYYLGPKLANLAGGAAVGTVAGLLVHSALWRTRESAPSKMVDELKATLAQEK